MSITIWIVIGIVVVLVWGSIIWEIWNAPLMPDDYMNEEEIKIWKELNGSKNKNKQSIKGNNEKENK